MITIEIKIVNEPRGVCLYTDIKKSHDDDAELLKRDLILNAIRDAAMKESQRLIDKGGDKTQVSKVGTAVYGIKPEDNPNILRELDTNP